jgi:hypothetical protein
MRKRKAKVVYRYRKRRSKPKSSGLMSGLKGIAMPLGAMIYGASREKVSDMIASSKIGQSLPATQFTDEIVMLGVNWGARKMGMGKGIGASILNAGKAIEYARVGQTVVDMYSNNSTSSYNGGAMW